MKLSFNDDGFNSTFFLNNKIDSTSQSIQLDGIATYCKWVQRKLFTLLNHMNHEIQQLSK